MEAGREDETAMARDEAGDEAGDAAGAVVDGHIASYYARTLSSDRVRPPLREDVETDVCVIGGGLAGLSTALGLAERGRAVVLLEARRLAWGASGRNGGFVSPGYSLGAEALLRAVGRDRARALYDLSRDGVELVRGRIARHGIAGAEPVAGRLDVWRYPDPEGQRRARDVMAETFGRREEIWPRERLRAVLATERYHGALFDPDGFHFHPLNYALGLAEAAEAAGLRIHENTPVRGLDLEAPEKLAVADHGRVRAKTLVFTCGGLLGRLVPRLAAAALPVATYVASTKPLGAAGEAAIGTRYSIADNRLANDYYRMVPGGRLLWGGGMSARTAEPRALAATMRKGIVSVYPRLAGLAIEDAWSGIMGYARHKMPQIGSLGPGLWYATSFGGHGMNTTAIAGELLAGALTEDDDRYRLFAPFGLDWTGGPVGPLAAQSTYWWYRLKDRIREGRAGAA